MYLPNTPENKDAHARSSSMIKASHAITFAGLGAAVLLVLPAERVMESRFPGEFLRSLAAVVPSISRWAELSPFPASTTLFILYVWLAIPVWTYLIFIDTGFRKEFELKSVNKGNREILFDGARVLLVLIPMIYLGFFFAIVDSAPCRICVNTSAWSQLAVGFTFLLATAGLSAFFLRHVTFIKNKH